MKTSLWWLIWPEAYRSKKHGETGGKKILIIIMMTVVFAKLRGNKVTISENLDLAKAVS